MCAWELLEYRNNQSAKKGEVLVCIPYKQNFSAKFVKGLMALDYPEGFAHSIYFETGQPVDVARNMMVSNALQRNCTHVLFLDQDIILKQNTLTDLHEAQFPICSAVYFSRAPPYNVVSNINTKPVSRDDLMTRLEKAPQHRAYMEVHEVGAGCMLVDMRVFKRLATFLDMQWYCMLRHPENPERQQLELDDNLPSYSNAEAIKQNYRCNVEVEWDEKGNPIRTCNNTLVAKFFDYRIGKENEDALSEDYYFNKLCRKVGFSIYLSIHTIVEHELPFLSINENGIMNSSVGAGILI